MFTVRIAQPDVCIRALRQVGDVLGSGWSV